MKPTNLLLTSVCLAVFASPALCDKVFFKATAQAKTAPGEAPDYIEGKVTSESDKEVTIRVEGGTITVTKDQVLRIERDALTVKDIEAKEAASRERLAAANAKREEAMGRWAEAVAQRHVEPKQSREIRIDVDFSKMIPPELLSYYDPILHRVDMRGLARAIEDYLRAELERLSNGGQ